MPLPRPSEARLYYRAAKQRFDDAQLLLRYQRTTGAVYLAGYVVECFMKALLLASATRKQRQELLREFRGARAHNVEWLGGLYRRHVGITIPREVHRHLLRVASWSTDLRYATGSIRDRESDEFIGSVEAIADWADGTM